jgi:hypothetical protein
MGRCKRGTCNDGLGVEQRCLGAYSVGMEASRSRSSALLWESSAVAMVFDGGFEVAVLEGRCFGEAGSAFEWACVRPRCLLFGVLFVDCLCACALRALS